MNLHVIIADLFNGCGSQSAWLTMGSLAKRLLHTPREGRPSIPQHGNCEAHELCNHVCVGGDRVHLAPAGPVRLGQAPQPLLRATFPRLEAAASLRSFHFLLRSAALPGSAWLGQSVHSAMLPHHDLLVDGCDAPPTLLSRRASAAPLLSECWSHARCKLPRDVDPAASELAKFLSDSTAPRAGRLAAVS